MTKAGYRDCWHLHIYGADNQHKFLAHVMGVHGERGVKGHKY